ncbi:GSH peroxidase [Finch poxvirus]|uniref:GSH peroxidase n=2 Tax=unclassified Avipoxvirus TaxID=336487 RepID=A0AAT9UQA2_9POXV|nr:GSH peroxidase [Finch poxvirus]UOX38923.1 GSH peroxidase [Finch poxvirus]
MDDDWILKQNIYGFDVNLIDGKNFKLSTYKDCICLFVNVASE